MSTNVADLGLRVRSEDVGTATSRLGEFVGQAGRAERATDSLAAATAGSGGVIAQLVASIERQMGVLIELQRAQQAAGVAASQLAVAEKAAAIAQEQGAAAAGRATAATVANAAASRGAASAAEEMAEEIARVNSSLAAEASATMKAAEVQERAVQQVRAYSQATHDLDGHVQAFLAHQAKLPAANDNIDASFKKVTGSSKALQYAQLNLGQQALDIGQGFAAAAASGEPLKMVMMTLMQQGPQVAGIFAELKTQGLSATGAMKGLWAAIAPIAVPLAAIGAVAATSFALFEREVDKNTKHATTWGDTWKATIKVTGDYLKDGPIGEGLKWLKKAFSDTLDAVTGIVAGGAIKIAGFFGASYLAIVNNWKRLPEVVGVILTNAANAAIKATEWLINKGIDGINALGKNFGFAQIGKVALGQFKSTATDIAKQFDADQKRIEDSAAKGMKSFLNDVAAQADKEWEKRQKASKKGADDTKAMREEVLHLNNALVAETVYTKAESEAIFEASQARLKSLDAAKQQITTFEEATRGQIRFSTKLEIAAADAEEAARAAREWRFDLEDLAYAINNNDWVSAFAGLVNVLARVDTAFKNAKTSQDKFAAAAQLAQGVGSAVGGKGGAVIGGVGSGALAGLSAASALTTLGVVSGPIGWAAMGVGALLGGLGGLFGGGGAKKRAREEAAAAEAQRVANIAAQAADLRLALLEAEGKTVELTEAKHQAYIASLSAENQALGEQVWQAQQKAEADAKAAEQLQTQIGLQRQLQAMDDAVLGTNVALLADRADERAKLDATSAALKDILWARQDEADLLAKNAARAKEVADYEAGLQDKIDGLTLSSAELRAKAYAKDLAAAAAYGDQAVALTNQFYALTAANDAAAEATAQQEAAITAYNEQLRLTTYVTDQATKAAEEQAQRLASITSGFQDAIKNAETLGQTISAFIHDLTGELGSKAQAQDYERTRTAVLSGEFTVEKAKAFLDSSKAYNATELGYQRDVALVRSLGQDKLTQLAGYPAALALMAQGMAQDQADALRRAQASYNPAGVYPYVGGSIPVAPVAPVLASTSAPSNDNGGISALASEVAGLKTVLLQIAKSTSDTADNTDEMNGTLRYGGG